MDTVLKVYNDGSHYVAQISQKNLAKKKISNFFNYDDKLFEKLYFETLNKKIYNAEQLIYIRDGFRANNQDVTDEYIMRSIEHFRLNILARKRRFTRKANLNEWNYFITVTNDDSKHSLDSFERRLKKCLSNMHTRRGWKYMGMFEHAPESGRIHFHGMLYIPDGQLVGEISLKTGYNFKTKKPKSTYENSFFAEAFGRNDFSPIKKFEIENGKAIDYILKYINKTVDNIFYSRGIPTFVEMPVFTEEFLAEMYHFGIKYVLCDDILTRCTHFIMRC